MKKLLAISVAASALVGAGCTTAAMAQQDTAHHDSDHNEYVVVRGHPAEDNTIVLRGVDVEMDGDEIIISGNHVRVLDDGRVAISGATVDVMAWHGRHDMAFSEAHHAMRLAEIEADLAAEFGQLEDMHIIVDELHMEGFEEAMEELERELGELENRRVVIVNGERRELTDEERAEIREELEEAREDIRESMVEVRRELAEGQDERREAMRVMRFELANAREEMRDAEREARRVFVRRAHHHADREALLEALREHGASRVRIETENGEDRVWIDDEEVEGEARLLWLERLDLERLEGGNETRQIVIETRDEDD